MDKEKKDHQKETDIDNILFNINNSLAEQITEEMKENEKKREKEQKEEEQTEEEQKKSRFPIWAKILGAAVCVVLVFGLGFAYHIVNRANFVKEFDGTILGENFEEDQNTTYQEVAPENITWAKEEEKKVQMDAVYNVLLVGEEALGEEGGRGRTDSIMIATINGKQGTLKLTSLMRDMYVQIPGFNDNKLNAAYRNGGIPLLYETIELNFGLKLDGSVLVNFEGFEKAIDALGGVELTLTENEARYLNTTNYISQKKYRNVSAGEQTLNGNQALGYSRVRYVRAIDDTLNDFGRTSRQRRVLTALFDKYKTKNIAEMTLILNDVLPYITTDIGQQDLITYLTTAVSVGASSLETCSLPVEGGYSENRVRGMSVLVPDLEVNREALKKFIFGDDVSKTTLAGVVAVP